LSDFRQRRFAIAYEAVKRSLSAKSVRAFSPGRQHRDLRRGVAMSSRSYKRFFISVQAVSSEESPQNPIARSSLEEGGETLTALYYYYPSEIATYAEAEDNCFQMAGKWIDEHTASPPKRVRA
jgi:hypothetical protein